MQQIKNSENLVLAEVFNVLNEDGFVTSADCPVQIASFHWKNGQTVDTHYHINNRKQTSKTVEGWLVLSESCIAFINCLQTEESFETVLTKGDLFLTYHGAHSIKALADNTIFVEIRNGPFLGSEEELKKIK